MKDIIEQKEEIVLCLHCDGIGWRVEKEYIPGHNSEIIEETIVCSPCEGTGRRVKTTLITIEPFKGSIQS